MQPCGAAQPEISREDAKQELGAQQAAAGLLEEELQLRLQEAAEANWTAEPEDPVKRPAVLSTTLPEHDVVEHARGPRLPRLRRNVLRQEQVEQAS